MKKLAVCLLSVITMVATLHVPAPAYEGQPLGRNVALNRTVKVSNSYNTNENNKPDYITDGNLERGYQAACGSPEGDNLLKDSQTWSMDLGREYKIDKIVLYWENAAAKKYKVVVSDDGKLWSQVAEEENGTAGKFTYNFTAVDAKYVKIELKERVMEQYGYCMYEWQIFTVGSAEEKYPTNLASSAKAEASGDDGSNSAANAIDGNTNTMWRTTEYQDPTVTEDEKANENLTLSWDTPQTFDTIKIKWNGGYMEGYKFQISNAGENWADVAEVTNGKASEYRTIRLDKAVTTSHLRLQGVKFGAYCFEVYEIEVYDQTNIPVENINLNYSSIKLNIDNDEDKKATLEYNLAPSNTSQKDIVWSSSNDGIVEVKDGVITGKSVGTAIITIASNDNPAVKQTCTVYVSKELDKANASAERSGNNIKVKWNKVNHASSYVVLRRSKLSRIEDVAYEGTGTEFVDEDLIPGAYTYIVKAMVDENDANANLYSDSTGNESEVVVIPEPVTGVIIANDYQHVDMVVGSKEKIKYNVLPTGATNTNVTFKSANENIARVDKDGVITGITEGDTKVTITTEEGGFTAECTVHVNGIDARGIERVGDKNISMGISQNRQLQVKINPDDTTNKNVTWTSSNSSVVTVENNGVIKSLNNGSAIITAATHNGLKTEFFVEVATPITGISLNYENATISPGQSIKLEATVNPANASDRNIKWISANETIATVDQSGNVKGELIGTTYISAVSSDGKIVKTCTVNVEQPEVTKPGRVKLLSVKKKGTKVTVKWKKNSDAVGYVVYMKTNSGKFKAVKTIKKAKTVKLSIKLKKGKKYSFKIRAYKIDDGDKVFGNYSKVKKVKM